MPAMKHSTHISGRNVVCVNSQLHSASTRAEVMSNARLVKWNFMRKSTGK